jgi:hypothetical protein
MQRDIELIRKGDRRDLAFPPGVGVVRLSWGPPVRLNRLHRLLPTLPLGVSPDRSKTR